MVKDVIKRILVPMDGSETSYKALDYAVPIALNSNADIHIINILDAEKLNISHEISDRFHPFYVEKNSPAEQADRYAFFYHDKLKDLKDKDEYKRAVNLINDAEKRAKANGLNIKGEISLGPVAHTIVNAAEKRECDLIVIGSRGLSGFKRLLMGHVASDVSRMAHCPVMVIR